jgi:hypothetical protein
MQNYKIEIEIFEGKGGKLCKEGDKIIYPELEKEGICAWMYRGDGCKSYQVGQIFNYPEDVGKLCPWLLTALAELFMYLSLVAHYPGSIKEHHMKKNLIRIV